MYHAHKMSGVFKRYDKEGRLVEYTINGIDQLASALPSKLAMTQNIIGAGAQVLIHGAKKVSREESGRRLSICRACEFYHKEGGDERCAKCGCFLNLKTRLEAWHCPINKW